jgi:5-methylthioadenosine/S-adenosylhomocysteine deaminase
VGDATFGKIVMYARQIDLPIHTHLAETRDEVAEARAATGVSPLARLDALGVTGPAFIAIHGVHLDAADIALLARQGCHVVHCPASNMKLASGVAPVAALLAGGVNVALGTDGAASNNRLDLFSEMRLASLLAKVTTMDAAVLPAATALAMATLNGARALGLDAVTGSLAAGKEADIVAVDLSGAATLPVFDPVSHLVNVADRSDVSDVWVRGVRMLERGALVTLDEASILARTRSWQQKLAAHPVP